jgi:integrase
MGSRSNTRRPYGTGEVRQVGNVWIGRWRVDGRRPKRSLGPVKSSRRPNGLNQKQAEAKLRQLMAETQISTATDSVTFEHAAYRHVARLELLGRKRSTIQDYRGYLKVHIVPALGHLPLEEVTRQELERFMVTTLKTGLSAKSVRNYLGLIHGVLDYAMKQEWIQSNPAKLVARPKIIESDPDFKFLNLAELDRLIDAVPCDELGRMERVLYLTAAMTGMRQGECIAARWRDVDWLAQRIRVRQNFVRGEFGTPKSHLSSRSVPLATRVARELELLFQRSLFKGDDDLVFAHPVTGNPYDKSKLLKRFKKARDRAKVTPITFHGLRHTFGTTMAAAGVPERRIQEWMGHRDSQTTQKYSHYAPGDHDAELVARAFGAGTKEGPIPEPVAITTHNEE